MPLCAIYKKEILAGYVLTIVYYGKKMKSFAIVTKNLSDLVFLIHAKPVN